MSTTRQARRRTRRGGIFIAVAALALASFGLTAGAANAAWGSYGDQILFKAGGGSYYTQSGTESAAVGALGATVKYPIEITNHTDTQQGYHVHLDSGLPWPVKVTTTGTLASTVASGQHTWFIATVNAHQTVGYVVSVTLPKTGPYYLEGTVVGIWPPGQTTPDASVTLISSVSVAGAGSHILTIVNGSQKAIGGGTMDQRIASPVITGSQFTSYIATVKNATTTGFFDSLRLQSACGQYRYQFIKGTTSLTGSTTYSNTNDDTADAESATGAGFYLAPGKSVSFKINVSVDPSVTPDGCSTGEAWIQSGVWEGYSTGYNFDTEDALLTNSVY